MKEIKFKIVRGVCMTKCSYRSNGTPHVYSSSCYNCKNYIGKIKNKNSIYCNADESNYLKYKKNYKILLLEFKVIENEKN